MKILVGAILLAVLTACQHRQLVPESADNAAVRFVQAFNDQDVEAMLRAVHEDVRYMFVEADQIHVETKNKQALAAYLPTFFQQTPVTQSSILYSQQQGYHISQVERATWRDQQGQLRSQCSWSVYQLQDGLIINIWYHSSFVCSAD